MKMMKKLDMQFIRYANLFEKITNVRTKHCFSYNEGIVFIVSKELVSRALGQDNRNLKKVSEILRKRIKIVGLPSGEQDIENFVATIIYPNKIRSVELKDGEATINAGLSKAMLIGRGKKRLEEMQDILGQYFNVKKLKIS